MSTDSNLSFCHLVALKISHRVHLLHLTDPSSDLASFSFLKESIMSCSIYSLLHITPPLLSRLLSYFLAFLCLLLLSRISSVWIVCR